jgi:hypothetical protein
MKEIIPLNLPPAPLKLRKREGQLFVWDPLRKKNLVLTPEEWVRQHLIFYLQSELNYPSTAFALEGGFKLFGKTQRTDLLVYSEGKPILIGECKAPKVKITQETFDQACRYNLHYKLPFLLISNGLDTYWAKVHASENRLEFLSEPLDFLTLKNHL